MKVDIAKWMPQRGEHVALRGIRANQGFNSVQTVMRLDLDDVFLTGGWVFKREKTGWTTPTGADITLDPAPQLNTTIVYPTVA